jgi:hypothetical protein
MIWRKTPVNVALTVLACTVVVSVPVRAQGRLTRTEDAAPIPRGMVRVRVLPSFARYDSRFARSAVEGSSTVPLAAALAVDSLGVAQIPGLSTSEVALRTLTGDASFRLSLGRSTSVATARVATTVITAEYGLTRWLTIGGLLPIVQSRSELFVTLNQDDDANANVGPNPVRAGTSDAATTARLQAIALQGQLTTVGTSLATRLAACDANPASDPSCPTILANRADVLSLLAETSAFGNAVSLLFGTTSQDAGQPFAPLSSTSTASAISTRLTTLTTRLRGYVGSTADQIVATVPVAPGPAGFADIQDLLLTSEFGLSPDSLSQTYRLNVGDIELGAKLLVLERGAWTPTAAAPSPWLRTRLTLTGLVRLGTGSPTLERIPHRYLETGTGDGQTDLEGGALLDVGLGPRVAVFAAARYTRQFGEVDAGRVPDENGVIHPFTPLHEGSKRLGDVFLAELTPRVLIGRYFGVDAHYALISRADDEYSPTDAGAAPLRRGGFTEQRIGLGLSYSTLRGMRTREPRLPVEVSIAHIETLAGSNGMVPRASRDQLELRLYYRLRR